ncbi:hypothetical protein GEMRC1_002966 [Eukaryota sp. GEM-RC1]
MQHSSKNHLLCEVCTEMMKDPCTLPCGHSFCRSCILTWLKKTPSCPNCRREIETPIDIEQFSVNIKLREAIEAHGSSSPDTLCQSCEEAAAVKFCVQCDNPLCDDCCSLLHKAKFMQSHSIVSLKERRKAEIKKCSLHPSKELEYFCSRCCVAVCMS